jgi:subtilisin family serine protease
VVVQLLSAAPGWALESGTRARTGDQKVIPVLLTFADRITDAERERSVDGLGQGPLRRLGHHVFLLPVAGRSAADKVRRLRRRPGVVGAEFDQRVSISTASGEPGFPAQWHLRNDGQVVGGVPGTPGADIYADAAWHTTTGSADVVVAVLDTGVDAAHPDLAANMWHNPGGIGGCPAGSFGFDVLNSDCFPYDDSGHGTHVAGSIGAVGNNGSGIAGVAWDVTLLALKALDAGGSGWTSDLIAALDRAVEAKRSGVNVRVVNSSLAGSQYSVAFLDEIVWAAANDILFVAAAGNDAGNNDVLASYPCAYPVEAIVCVANSTNQDALHPSSNSGPLSVDLAAPGTDILSTYPGGYAVATGTSMSAPQVSGTAALILATGYRSVSSLKERILAGTDPVASLSGLVRTGGRLNACKAIPGCDPALLPDAPTGVTARAGAGNAAVSWTAPWNNPRYPLTGSLVTADPGGARAAAGSGLTAATVPGLTNGTDYTFTVAATNAAGTGPSSEPTDPVTPMETEAAPPPPRSGYWMVSAGGTVYEFGDAGWLGDARVTDGGEAVDLSPTPSGAGYWILDSAGIVSTFGDAAWFGDLSGLVPGERATSLSATPAGDGYWIFTTRGRVLRFGAARSYGDLLDLVLNGPVLDSIATPSGKGYYMVASDGGVFAFGDARFHGSMGGVRLNAPVQSLVPDPDGTGYWLVASDGGVFSFQAPFRGSMGTVPLNRPVTGMLPFGNGYLMVGEDGGIFSFSDMPFRGSLGANPPPRPIVSVAALD